MTFIIERDNYVLYVLLIQINFRNTKIELYIKWIKIKTKVVMIYKLKMLSNVFYESAMTLKGVTGIYCHCQ